jgi:circadian clock protein KaiC
MQQEIERKQREIERKKTLIEAQIIALRTQFELEKEDLDRLIARELLRVETFALDNLAMSNVRQADELVEDLTDKGAPL